MIARKSFDFDHLAMQLFGFCPCETVHTPVGLGTTRIVHLPIIFEWTVEDFSVLFNRQDDFFGCIPTIHQDSPKLELLLVNTIEEHLLEVVKFRFAISIWIINSIVNDPSG